MNLKWTILHMCKNFMAVILYYSFYATSLYIFRVCFRWYFLLRRLATTLEKKLNYEGNHVVCESQPEIHADS